MTHPQLVEKAEDWLRSYGCSLVLSEQACVSGEMPDAIGWKGSCHSVLVECKVSRPDFLADGAKPFRSKPVLGLGCERYYLVPRGLVELSELPNGWGLLEHSAGRIRMIHSSSRSLRSTRGMRFEMNLLLASLRRVELRIEPQRITEFLKWKNRLAAYNGGRMPKGVKLVEDEPNSYLREEAVQATPIP
jgi:hypothetical protein